MGCIVSKSKNSDDDLRGLIVSQKSSCGLTEYWNVKKESFQHKYFNKFKSPKVKASDFRVATLLGEGAFGAVTLSIHKETGGVFATKVITKKKIVKQKLVSFFKCR